MKIFSTFLLFLILFTSFSQQDKEIAITGNPIEMLFPNGKTKALILSYDDGRIEDRKLVELLNKYKLIGTFHLNSNKLDTENYLTKPEINTLFKGHEVSVHSANHPNFTRLSKIDVIYEVVEDRKELEKLMNYPIRGMAYPFGNNNQKVIEALSGTGIEYARTVDDTYNFSIPNEFLKWHPTIHQFAKAFWIPNDEQNDKKELEFFYQTITNFLQTKDLSLLNIWGHSWEMGNEEKKWTETEKFFQLIANNVAIHYTSFIDFVDYINAYQNLKFSVNKTMVTNPSAIKVHFKYNQNEYVVLAGQTINL